MEKKETSLIAVFLFYNRGIGKYNCFSFSKRFIHCALLCYQGDHCILFEIAPYGFIYRILRSNDVNKNLNAIKKLPSLSAFIAVEIKMFKKVNAFFLKGYTCNEVCRYFSGVDIGWTFNPKHLYKKLIKLKDKRNYELLALWSRV